MVGGVSAGGTTPPCYFAIGLFGERLRLRGGLTPADWLLKLSIDCEARRRGSAPILTGSATMAEENSSLLSVVSPLNALFVFFFFLGWGW